MIKSKQFQASRIGFFTKGRDQKLTDDACQQARAWINRQENIQVVDISLALSQMSAIAVVWYEGE